TTRRRHPVRGGPAAGRRGRARGWRRIRPASLPALRPPRPSTFFIAAGALVLLAGVGVTLMPLFEAAQWQASPEAERAQRNADVPTPIWLTPTPRAIE